MESSDIEYKIIVINILRKKRKDELSQISHLSSCLRNLEKEEQTIPKSRRRNEIINTRAEIENIKTLPKQSP